MPFATRYSDENLFIKWMAQVLEKLALTEITLLNEFKQMEYLCKVFNYT